MAAPLTLKTAIGTYQHTRPLKDGRITSPRVCLDHVEIVPANRAFRPMVNQLAYDLSELALVTYLLARTFQRPLVGVPVILMQQSAYNMLLVRPDSPLTDPRSLAGKTIGVRSYSQTTGVWLRGMLHDQFGLDLDSLSWITFEPSHVDGFVDPPNARRAPDGATVASMLRAGEIDAAAGLEPADYPDLRHLIPNAVEVEREWVRQTGVEPINHTLVVRQDIVTANPWLVDELARMVRAAKAFVSTDGATSPAADVPADGVEPNRGGLTLLARYAFEQHITPRTLTAEELYPGP
ncbi:MAG TPA: ABC transporter substrate-binding protein [Chloroflexota bacterium]|nr:ABC transporter substrate-binding protein [Chloroflexota bacterium]